MRGTKHNYFYIKITNMYMIQYYWNKRSCTYWI